MSTPTTSEVESRAAAVAGSWFSSVTYEPVVGWAERSGMCDRRRRLLSSARGDVLELGAGTGLNLPHYPEGLDRLVLAEPEEHMARRLRKRLGGRPGRKAEVVRAPAEAIPAEDRSFDTVVATLVLCTVEDPERALAEIRRVLRPAGALLFLEHVRADDPRLARWQDRLHGAWRSFADGCNCNRETSELLRDAGFEVAVTERGNWRRMPPIVHPLLSGIASPTATRSDPARRQRPTR